MRAADAARGRRVLAHGIALVVAAMSVSACTEVESAAVEGYEPTRLDEVRGTDFLRVTITKEGARRAGLRTDTIRGSGRQTTVPYAALIYEPDGKTYVYTSPKARTFMRAEVKVRDIRGDRAMLVDGPPAGTTVVTVGAAEVYGAELDIAGSH
jgi:hypothetical protein